MRTSITRFNKAAVFQKAYFVGSRPRNDDNTNENITISYYNNLTIKYTNDNVAFEVKDSKENVETLRKMETGGFYVLKRWLYGDDPAEDITLIETETNVDEKQ